MTQNPTPAAYSTAAALGSLTDAITGHTGDVTMSVLVPLPQVTPMEVGGQSGLVVDAVAVRLMVHRKRHLPGQTETEVVAVFIDAFGAMHPITVLDEPSAAGTLVNAVVAMGFPGATLNPQY